MMKCDPRQSPSLCRDKRKEGGGKKGRGTEAPWVSAAGREGVLP